jgi:ankyrin repeat protein
MKKLAIVEGTMKVLKVLLLAAALILTNISVGETNENEMIQARKDLSSMGLTYNDREAFIKSLNSRDKIAIKLFINAGGLDTQWLIRDYGSDAFGWAAAAGDVEIVKLMVDIFLDDKYPMYVGGAIIEASRNGRVGTVEFLADKIKGIKDDKKRRILEGYLGAAFQEAVKRGKAGVVKLLLRRGADVNSQSNGGMSALMWAAKNNYPEIVKMLLDNGADNNIRDNYGKTALSYAEENEHQEIVKLLKKQ